MGYVMPFRSEEVANYQDDVSELRGLSTSAHLTYLRTLRRDRSSPMFYAISTALEETLLADSKVDERPLKVVLVTVAWGARLVKYLPGQMQRMDSLGLLQKYVVFCH